jgi:RNA polymerase subunit RPABC4/transcription elongation factor Spt4
MTKETNKRESERTCPYCEREILTAKLPFCKPCGVTLRYCVICQIAVEREAEVCPQCGGKVEWK